jgi:hypothetical protein
MRKILPRLFPLPNTGTNQTISPEKTRESTANEKNYLTQSQNVHKNSSLHLSSKLPVSGLRCTSLAFVCFLNGFLINPCFLLLSVLVNSFTNPQLPKSMSEFTELFKNNRWMFLSGHSSLLKCVAYFYTDFPDFPMLAHIWRNNCGLE